MQLRIADIGFDGLCLDFIEEIEHFPVLQALVQGKECNFLAPLKVGLRASLISGIVEVVGRVETEVEVPCSRCLNPASVAINAFFELTYVRELPSVDEESDEEGIELTAEDMGLILYAGDEIDLTEAIQEQVVLALPLHPLCARECRGLCPQCGANLNETTCGCASQDFNIKFAALNKFKVDK